MDVSKKEYSEMTDKASPSSKSLKNICLAFLSGGFICTIGQVLFNVYMNIGLAKQDARALVSITLIFLGALLTSLKVYDNLAKYCGAGTLVPITGFANAIVAPAIEFKTEGHVMGIGSKMFVIAGPVLVFGVTASVVHGLILWIISFFT